MKLIVTGDDGRTGTAEIIDGKPVGAWLATLRIPEDWRADIERMEPRGRVRALPCPIVATASLGRGERIRGFASN